MASRYASLSNWVNSSSTCLTSVIITRWVHIVPKGPEDSSLPFKGRDLNFKSRSILVFVEG